MNCPVCASPSSHAGEKAGYEYRRCDKCGLLFTQGVKPEHVRSQNLDIEPRHTDATENARYQAMLDLGPGVNFHRPLQTVIDFGCGQGETGRFLRARGIHVLDIDLDTPLQIGDIRDAWIDGIMLVDVIEHLDNPLDIFRDMARVLKTLGVIVVEVDLSEGKGVDWNLCDPTVHHVQMHTAASLQALADSVGMIIRRVSERIFVFEFKLEGIQFRKDKPENA